MRTLLLATMAFWGAVGLARVHVGGAREVYKTPDQFSVEEIHKSAALYQPTRYYVHHWVPFPPIEGELIEGQAIEPHPPDGVGEVVVFTASWCVPCQTIAPYLAELKKKYVDSVPVPKVRFVSIASHDLKADAKQFADHFGVAENVVLANHEIHQKFHHPQLPTVYIRDRNGWLLARFTEVTIDDGKKIEKILASMTAL